MKSLIWGFIFVFNLVFNLLGCTSVQAGPLADRVDTFPNWHTKPIVERATGDLVYPDWIAGTWRVKSTLVELAAPLAPEIVTPGFESNRTYLNQPVPFEVRFGKSAAIEKTASNKELNFSHKINPSGVVADRAFNGLNIARAYLGNRAVLAVKVDPNSPNKQITLLQDDRSLTSTITGRAIETPAPEQFITTEIFQQIFRGTPQPYFNEVETTTAYRYFKNRTPGIEADQITAIYLSSQDPNYFKASDTPVALYRYRLEFSPLAQETLQSD